MSQTADRTVRRVRHQTKGRLLEVKSVSPITPKMLRIGISGTPNELIPKLEGLVAAGARHLSFGPPLGPDPVAAIQLLGREVLPYFR